jgi:hypothetical protein
MSGRVNEWMNWICGGMDVWMGGRVGEWMDGFGDE